MTTPLQAGIEIAAILCMFIAGLSHVVCPRAWIDLFISLRERGEPGALILALLHLPLALAIVSLHNVWKGIPAVLTVLGYAWMVKAALYLVFPRLGLRGLSCISHERAGYVIGAGLMLILLATVLAYGSLST